MYAHTYIYVHSFTFWIKIIKYIYYIANVKTIMKLELNTILQLCEET